MSVSRSGSREEAAGSHSTSSRAELDPLASPGAFQLVAGSIPSALAHALSYSWSPRRAHLLGMLSLSEPWPEEGSTLCSTPMSPPSQRFLTWVKSDTLQQDFGARAFLVLGLWASYAASVPLHFFFCNMEAYLVTKGRVSSNTSNSVWSPVSAIGVQATALMGCG